MQPETHGRLKDIRQAITFIEDDTRSLTFESFVDDRRVWQPVIYNLQVIGEAMNRMRRQDPEMARRISYRDRMVDFRNALVHGYDDINFETVWEIVETFLPGLKAEVDALLE
ncbi:MAG: DUF86 domain-containing protein [Chloroflexota bacterium]|nr:DUF86 domain-containing protein [Chloroflexota bacterium]